MTVEYENEREARIVDDKGIIIAKIYICTDGLLVTV